MHFFSIQKPQRQHLTMPQNKSRSTKGQNLFNLGSTGVRDSCYIPSFKAIDQVVLKKIVFKLLPFMDMAVILVM